MHMCISSQGSIDSKGEVTKFKTVLKIIVVTKYSNVLYFHMVNLLYRGNLPWCYTPSSPLELAHGRVRVREQ